MVKKVLIPFIAGIAVATLGVSLVNKRPASAFLERPSGAPTSREVNTTYPGSEIDSPGTIEPNEFLLDSESSEIAEQAGSRDEQSANERPPPELPIYLPPEFDWIAESPGSFAGFDSFQREPYDPNWAPAMESHLTDYLRENPEITQTYGNPIINCRTTRCQLAFVAYGLDATLDDVQHQLSRAFNDANSGFFERSEFGEFGTFGRVTMLDHHTEDGVTSIIWHLTSEKLLESPPFNSN